jgi:hypothetical protein
VNPSRADPDEEPIVKLFRRIIILSHRYLGIAVCLLAVMWFATGFVMMYAGGMPRLTPEVRLDRLPPLDLSGVRLTAAEAVDRVGASSNARISMVTVLERPAYRITGRSGTDTVFADTGEVMPVIGRDESRRVASRFLGTPEDQIHFAGTLTKNDQWTLIQGPALPLHKYRVQDEAATELYVSPRTAEVTQVTTRRSRTLAWVGTIPHWLYFSAIRLNQPLWYTVVVWTSALVCAVTLLGLVLGVLQYHRGRPTLRQRIPYSGWTRWHYVTGVVFGVFTLTWAFSGLLSMEPFDWTNSTGLEVRGDVFTGGAAEAAAYDRVDAARWEPVLAGRTLKELEFVRIQDEHYYVAHVTDRPVQEKPLERLHQPYYITGRADANRLLVAASTMAVRREPFSADSLITRLHAALPGETIVSQELLTDYDDYYYSRSRQIPLPILRVKFADPAQTWLYIDPETSQMVSQVTRLSRVERWLYNGLHSLDFAFWYDRRPLWDIGMIVLLSGGLASSLFGVLLGVRRIRRGITGAAKGLAPGLPPVPDTATQPARTSIGDL